MNPTDVELLLSQLDGSGSDAEWKAIEQLRSLPGLPNLLVDRYGQSKSFGARANPAVDLAPFGRWTLRDEAAQRRSP